MEVNKYGSRKFIVTMSGLVTAFILALMGKLTADYAMIDVAVIGSYNLANAGVAYFSNRKVNSNEEDRRE